MRHRFHLKCRKRTGLILGVAWLLWAALPVSAAGAKYGMPEDTALSGLAHVTGELPEDCFYHVSEDTLELMDFKLDGTLRLT